MITPRLACIINQVTRRRIGDIGTDHAYIPIQLIREGTADRVIATDIRTGPVETARRNIKKHGLQEKIQVRQGSGLSPLDLGETEEIIIAGMGGQLICEILDAEPELAHSQPLILQPMNCQYELRRYLHRHNFSIETEDLAAEGFKVYNICRVRAGPQTPFPEEIFYHLPPDLWNHPNFPRLLAKKEREFTKILSGLGQSKTKDSEAIAHYAFLLKELNRIKMG